MLIVSPIFTFGMRTELHVPAQLKALRLDDWLTMVVPGSNPGKGENNN